MKKGMADHCINLHNTNLGLRYYFESFFQIDSCILLCDLKKFCHVLITTCKKHVIPLLIERGTETRLIFSNNIKKINLIDSVLGANS